MNHHSESSRSSTLMILDNNQYSFFPPLLFPNQPQGKRSLWTGRQLLAALGITVSWKPAPFRSLFFPGVATSRALGAE